MALDRWTQFGIDYPEIFAYLLGQVAHKFVADHRLMDLITLVNSIPVEVDEMPTHVNLPPASPSTEYTVKQHDFFYEAVSPDGRTIDGSTDKLYIEGLVDNLNTETVALRRQLASEQAELAKLQSVHQKTVSKCAQDKEDLRRLGNDYIEIQKTLDIVRASWRTAEEKLSDAIKTADFNQDRIDDLDHMVNEARQERDKALDDGSKLSNNYLAALNRADNYERDRDSAYAKLVECEHAHMEASKQRDAATELYNAKHQRIEELKTELEAAKKRIGELGKQMEDAGYWLGLADSSDENASRAYDILKGLNQS